MWIFVSSSFLFIKSGAAGREKGLHVNRLVSLNFNNPARMSRTWISPCYLSRRIFIPFLLVLRSLFSRCGVAQSQKRGKCSWAASLALSRARGDDSMTAPRNRWKRAHFFRAAEFSHHVSSSFALLNVRLATWLSNETWDQMESWLKDRSK